MGRRLDEKELMTEKNKLREFISNYNKQDMPTGPQSPDEIAERLAEIMHTKKRMDYSYVDPEFFTNEKF